MSNSFRIFRTLIPHHEHGRCAQGGTVLCVNSYGSGRRARVGRGWAKPAGKGEFPHTATKRSCMSLVGCNVLEASARREPNEAVSTEMSETFHRAVRT